MARKTTPSHVLTLRLCATSKDDSVFIKAMEAHRQLYNAVLGEALTRLRQMRQDSAFGRACDMRKGKERTAAFKALNEKYALTSPAMEKFAQSCRDQCYIRDHARSDDTQKTAKRAYQAVMEYAFGRRGRPRFKGKRGLHSIEGKKNVVIRVRNGVFYYLGREVPILFDRREKERAYQQFDEDDIKFCRLTHTLVKGKRHWYLQLVLEGHAPIKEKRQKAFAEAKGKKVGLDFGPSQIAVVGETDAALLKLAEEVEQPWQRVRQLQRAMDRSRRAMNPDNYLPDGCIRPGKKTWTYSNNYWKLHAEYVETERLLTAIRRHSHGRLANLIFSMGSNIFTEKVSYKAWQKNFGRSHRVRAPGMLQSILVHKAESAGGSVMLISTQQTRLSQYCHVRDDYTKKPLSQRYHEFPDGNRVQRDLYSAFLAMHVVERPGKDKAKPVFILDTQRVAESAARTALDSRLTRTVSKTQDQLMSGIRKVNHVSRSVISGTDLRQNQSSADPDSPVTRPAPNDSSRRLESPVCDKGISVL